MAAFVLLNLLTFGCSKGDPNFPGYKVASGDLTSFVLDSAVYYGARRPSTNGLQKLQAEWRYKADKDGVHIYSVGDNFHAIESMLRTAFGPPAIPPKTNENARVSGGVYAAPAIGVAIQFLYEETKQGRYTVVLIVRPKALNL